MTKLGLFGIVGLVVLSLATAPESQARVSLTGIDAKLDALATQIDGLRTPGEPAKITLFGNLSAGDTFIFGGTASAVVPSDRRFHVRHVSCGRSGVTAVLQGRPFSLSIDASHFSPEVGGLVREIVVSTPRFAPGVVTLDHITRLSVPATIAIDPGAEIRMALSRDIGAPTDGSITRFQCTLGGFMEDVS